jgi:hypothetical protein
MEVVALLDVDCSSAIPINDESVGWYSRPRYHHPGLDPIARGSNIVGTATHDIADVVNVSIADVVP